MKNINNNDNDDNRYTIDWRYCKPLLLKYEKSYMPYEHSRAERGCSCDTYMFESSN